MKHIFGMAALLALCALALALAGCSASGAASAASQSAAPSAEFGAAQAAAPAATAKPAAAPTPEPSPKPTPEPTVQPGPDIQVADGITYVNGILVANKTYSLPPDYNPGVNPDAQAAFNEMAGAAANEGLNIYISSGFRSYDYQAGLYQRYVNRDGQAAADTYSARPGHSEHQTGLAFDLNTISDSFANTPEGQWVAVHCHEYGFILRYPADKEEITGYKYEPWHLRYLGVEQATAVAESGLCLEEYLGIDSVYAE